MRIFFWCLGLYGILWLAFMLYFMFVSKVQMRHHSFFDGDTGKCPNCGYSPLINIDLDGNNRCHKCGICYIKKVKK